jgi:NADH dehydrogenase
VQVFMTGGSGFLGRHVVAALLAGGHRVCVLTRDPTAARAAARVHGLPAGGVDFLQADLASPRSLQGAFADPAPDVVVHAAALLDAPPDDLEHVNVGGTRALLEALATSARPPRLVLVSSFATEDFPPTPYSESKLRAEALVRESGLPFVIVRPTLIYGRGDGQNTARLVAALRSGTMWLPGGGRTRIQPVHVEDVAAACVAAATAGPAIGRTYRLGGPEPVSVRAFREAVRDASGGRAHIRALPLAVLALGAPLLALAGRRGAAGVLAFHRADHAVDSSDAQRDLGLRPRDLAQGLAETFGSR